MAAPPSPIVAPPAPPPLVRPALVLPKAPTPPRVPIAAPPMLPASMSTNTPPNAAVSAPSGLGERRSASVEDEDEGRPTVLIVVAAMMAGVMLAAGLLVVSQIMFREPTGPTQGPVVVEPVVEAPPPEVTPPSEVAPPVEVDACDGVIDGDGDGVLPCAPSTEAALARVRLGELKAYDCDDKDPKVNPAAKGDGRGVDNNCDGKVEGNERKVSEPQAPPEACFQDLDGDGYGNVLKPLRGEVCRGKNVSKNSEDCLDTNARWYPGASEPPGSPDMNCDGETTTAVEESKPPVTPRVLSATGSLRGKRLTVNVALDPNGGPCNALYVQVSGSPSFITGETTIHAMSGGPTDFQAGVTLDQKESYFRLRCADNGPLRIGAPYYPISQ